MAAAACQKHGFTLTAVDVDADPALAEQYGECVPVVAIDGKVRFPGPRQRGAAGADAAGRLGADLFIVVQAARLHSLPGRRAACTTRNERSRERRRCEAQCLVIAGCVLALAAATTLPPAGDAPKADKDRDLDALAARLVTQSARVGEGERVVISGDPKDAEVLEDLAVQVRRQGRTRSSS